MEIMRIELAMRHQLLPIKCHGMSYRQQFLLNPELILYFYEYRLHALFHVDIFNIKQVLLTINLCNFKVFFSPLIVPI